MIPSDWPKLGLGISGPHATRFVSEKETVRLVHAAIEMGVTLFDTGPMYGAGEAERRLGLALKGVPRDKVFVVTKVRTFMPDGAFCPPFETQLRASLKRLGRNDVDAVLLHGPRAAEVSRGWTGDLRQAKALGMIRYGGVCARDAARWAIWDDPANADQYDLLMTPLDDPALLARAAQTGVGVLAIETMRSRRRFRLPRSQADLWYLARDVRDAWTNAPQPSGPGLEAALSLPGVRSAIVTTTRPAHLEENARRAGVIRPTG